MRRSRPPQIPRTRFVAVFALGAITAVAAFLAACPPARELPADHGQSTPAVQPPTTVFSGSRPMVSGLPPQRPQPEERGILALVVDDAGYSLEELQVFLDLTIPLTVAVLPNLPHSTEAARRVLAAGKDLILHCPMEPGGGENPGPGAILTGQSPLEIRHLLDMDFSSVPGARGMNNHMGSRATADEAVMRVVLGYLKEKGLLFVDSRTTADTAGPRVAEALGLPILQRDVFLDDDTRESEIARWLGKGIADARNQGSAVAIGHVQNRAVAHILRSAELTLAAQGVRMARLPEVLAARERKVAP